MGIAIYYIIQFVFAILAVVALEIGSPDYNFDEYETGITWLSITVSALGWLGYYLFIKGRWENELDQVQEVTFDSELLDDEMLLS